MRIYPPEYLRELRALCDRHDVFLVVDEVFAGYGRTGTMWASEHAGIAPDVMCVGKAFASLVPMGATLATERIFDAFRGAKDRALYYGHAAFCGYPLGAALAREVLAIYRDEDILGQVARKGRIIERAFAKLASLPGVERVRSIGGSDRGRSRQGKGGYLGTAGWRVFDEARARGLRTCARSATRSTSAPPLTIEEGDLAAAPLDRGRRASLTATFQ